MKVGKVGFVFSAQMGRAVICYTPGSLLLTVLLQHHSFYGLILNLNGRDGAQTAA